jgi:glycosyltransferase involved in cell wall biosynthesis
MVSSFSARADTPRVELARREGSVPARPSAARRARTGVPVVVVTSFFPSSVDPQRTVFVKNLVAAMRALREVIVLAPSPRRPWPAVFGGPLPARSETIEGIPVTRPRYLAVPGLGWLSSLTYFCAIARALKALRRERGEFVIHAHCAYPDGVAAAAAARWLGVPCVVTAHGSDINVHSAQPLLRPQIAWALKRAAAVVAVSGALAAKISAITRDASTEVVCIPCAGYDPRVFAMRERSRLRVRLGLAADARLIVYAGQLVALKQVNVLVEAWRRLFAEGRLLAADRLVVAGAGPMRAALERQVRDAGLDVSVIFTGSIPQSQLSSWVAAADALCLPSRSEGMPNVIVEALASGVPVVASRVGGIPELIIDGVNGLLVAPGDPQALAEALARCITMRWSPESVRSSVEHLTWSALARRNLDLIDAVVASKTRNASVA